MARPRAMNRRRWCRLRLCPDAGSRRCASVLLQEEWSFPAWKGPTSAMHRGPWALVPPLPFAAAIDASLRAPYGRFFFPAALCDAGVSSSQGMVAMARGDMAYALRGPPLHEADRSAPWNKSSGNLRKRCVRRSSLAPQQMQRYQRTLLETIAAPCAGRRSLLPGHRAPRAAVPQRRQHRLGPLARRADHGPHGFAA